MQLFGNEINTMAWFLVAVVFSSLIPHNVGEALAFTQGEFASLSANHTIILLVQQRNIDHLKEILLNISDNLHPRYGQFLSFSQVGRLVQNSNGTQAVRHWLESIGAHVENITPHGEYISAIANVSTWANALQGTFYNYYPAENITRSHMAFSSVVRTSNYTLPRKLTDHVYSLMGVSDFPVLLSRYLNKQPRTLDASERGAVVNINVLKGAYNIQGSGSSATQAIFGSIQQTFSPDDIAAFHTRNNVPNSPVANIVGNPPSGSICAQQSSQCMEATLDLQYVTGISHGATTTYWYVEPDNNAELMDWIMSVSAMRSPPMVHSISYGVAEGSVPPSVLTAFENEAVKLGVRGVTIVVAAGDDGVAGYSAAGLRCRYSPSWPASSAYVTAVGATKGLETHSPEIVCSSRTGCGVTTGGGFSINHAQPSWQKAAVDNYFRLVQGTASEPVPGFNAAGRAFPDVSLAGDNIEVIVGGQVSVVAGSSASAPIFAAMVTLVNSARLAKGMRPVGFINPAIYSNNGAFAIDVTSGDTRCTRDASQCCSQGFYATPSWDPASGFGSIDFAKFFDYFVGGAGSAGPGGGGVNSGAGRGGSYNGGGYGGGGGGGGGGHSSGKSGCWGDGDGGAGHHSSGGCRDGWRDGHIVSSGGQGTGSSGIYYGRPGSAAGGWANGVTGGAVGDGAGGVGGVSAGRTSGGQPGGVAGGYTPQRNSGQSPAAGASKSHRTKASDAYAYYDDAIYGLTNSSHLESGVVGIGAVSPPAHSITPAEESDRLIALTSPDQDAYQLVTTTAAGACAAAAAAAAAATISPMGQQPIDEVAVAQIETAGARSESNRSLATTVPLLERRLGARPVTREEFHSPESPPAPLGLLRGGPDVRGAISAADDRYAGHGCDPSFTASTLVGIIESDCTRIGNYSIMF